MIRNTRKPEIERALQSLQRQSSKASRFKNYWEQLICFELVWAHLNIKLLKADLQTAQMEQRISINKAIGRIRTDMLERHGPSWKSFRPPFNAGVSSSELRFESRLLKSRVDLLRDRMRELGDVNFQAMNEYQQLKKRYKR